MKYQEFIENVKAYVSSQLDSGQKVTIQQITKNNGIVYDGLFIVDPILNVSPTIYLNPYYHRYLGGVSLEDIYEDILMTYQINRPKQDFDVSVFTDFSKARDRIVFKLINRRRNEVLLRQVPYIPYMDLAIVFVCTVTEFSNEYATILIHHEHLQLWNIKPEELYQIAMRNTPQLLPHRLESMENFLDQFTHQTISFPEPPQMYILTNCLKVHGASCMIYPGVLEALANELDSDLVILPSSIHEVLIISEQSASKKHSFEELDALIQEVNDTQVSDLEILGEHAYLFNKDTGSIEF